MLKYKMKYGKYGSYFFQMRIHERSMEVEWRNRWRGDTQRYLICWITAKEKTMIKLTRTIMNYH